ncbi:hypothetical protein LSCM1_02362 [Leishmania martiniquensis]|uniref:AAA+ ATPase domain-containing protein n=1 Tax=Leishmania martiniquensis TaxID=1580590 RepID=A0A836KDF1_9TRYP|nr:hypothetical protein LSCM1_02362 [Leishmania martiniquensis]
MEAKKVEETRVLVCQARDLLRGHLIAAPGRPLFVDAQHELGTTLQQLLPCLSILRSYEREYAYLSTYELVIGATRKVHGSLTAVDATMNGEDRQLLKAKHGVIHHRMEDSPDASAAPSTSMAPKGATATSISASALKPAAATAPPVTWRNTYGCADAILALRQATTLPMQHPSLFTGPRQPWRRLLLYGPPGTGKTRLAAATAAEYGAVFLSVSAADLLSKWVGESEKHVRHVFAQASASAPRCVLFFDEVDALCSARGGYGESELARRLKTELLLHLQMDLPAVTVLAATNLPWELDAAFLRRFDRFIHVGLPTDAVKRSLLVTELRGVAHTISSDALDRIVAQTERFSVVDMRRLLSHAVMAPVTEWLLLAQATDGSPSDDSEALTGAEHDGLDVVSAAAATAPAPLLSPSSPSRTHTESRCRSMHRLADTEILGGGVRSATSRTQSTPSPLSSPSPSSPRSPACSPAKNSSSLSHWVHLQCRRPCCHADEVPHVEYRHFEKALQAITATTTSEEMARYATWRSRSTVL